MIDWWARFVPQESLFVAYGGTWQHYRELNGLRAFYVDDARLRTRDHARERQSYTGVFRASAEQLSKGVFSHAAFFEFDHVPIIPDLLERLSGRLEQSSADVLCYCLRRIDRTISPHYLSHAHDSRFHNVWRRMSVRQDKEAILSFFPSGSLWRIEAFDAVAHTEEKYPIYLEIYLPTLAHHLGFRLTDMGDQNRFIRALPTKRFSLAFAQQGGAWTIHPLKDFWDKALA